jgi:hypothetical protein
MMTTEHWAILGQFFVFVFAFLGLAAVIYVAAKELER